MNFLDKEVDDKNRYKSKQGSMITLIEEGINHNSDLVMGQINIKVEFGFASRILWRSFQLVLVEALIN